VWTEQAKLQPAGGSVTAFFGSSVALEGDTAVIGAFLDVNDGVQSGSVYVFTRVGGVWSEQARLTPPDGAEFDAFGDSAALDGDTVLIGAMNDDDNGFESGSAYVFRLYDDDVPATSVIGLVLLLLAVLGTGVYFMRRRAAG
jgi:hypothetical protein